MTGICAEVCVGDPSICQVAALSGRSGPITGVTRASSPDDSGDVVEEFTHRGESDFHWADDPEAETVFSYGEETVYRFSRDPDQGCVCEIVERSGCTVRQIRAVDESLVITFLAIDLETIRSVVSDLRERHGGVSVRRLTRSADDDAAATAIVDLNALTDRQHETIATAYRMGYFEHPKDASAAEVAEELGIAIPTFTEHLAAAQRKLLDELLDEESQSRAADPVSPT